MFFVWAECQVLASKPPRRHKISKPIFHRLRLLSSLVGVPTLDN